MRASKRCAVGSEPLLAQTELREGLTRGDAQLAGNEIDIGDLLRDCVFHLDSRILFDEHVLTTFVEEELYRARARIADLSGDCHRIGTDFLKDVVGNIGRGC